MNKQANRLQESLERLEGGETLEDSRGSLPVEEHLSLSLVSRLRATAWPRHDPQISDKQRRQVIALYTQEAEMDSDNPPDRKSVV